MTARGETVLCLDDRSRVLCKACRGRCYREVVHLLVTHTQAVIQCQVRARGWVQVQHQQREGVGRQSVVISGRAEHLKRFSAGRTLGYRRRKRQKASCPKSVVATATYLEVAHGILEGGIVTWQGLSVQIP